MLFDADRADALGHLEQRPEEQYAIAPDVVGLGEAGEAQSDRFGQEVRRRESDGKSTKGGGEDRDVGGRCGEVHDGAEGLWRLWQLFFDGSAHLLNPIHRPLDSLLPPHALKAESDSRLPSLSLHPNALNSDLDQSLYFLLIPNHPDQLSVNPLKELDPEFLAPEALQNFLDNLRLPAPPGASARKVLYDYQAKLIKAGLDPVLGHIIRDPANAL
mmetsp:Transcript_13343/g.24510  ORF Transcript_13343/g.24510 Transcript_13343/m.24510 type:complete len:215 (+) Transcript_13343:413-1057(+)